MRRLSPDRQDPAMRLFVLQLSLDTHTPRLGFATWVHDNRAALRDGFACSSEPDDFREVENCCGIWLRQQFQLFRQAIQEGAPS